ncbi:DUF2530 domain-containing protein [Nocardia farcinica]|uniref:DUF2530 domain-containing protein n=1 Tax=Nocardia farcinica TaxID=37329 RepID=UPI002453E510|nr:DUF2530 domain-containing protein [Nocardia farcinica]
MVDTWVAPGRVNIIGEHTDYNDGYVLPIALPLVTRCAARVTAQPVVRVRSRQRPDEPVRAELDAIDAVRTQVPGWARYVLGVVGEFVRRGHPVGGLDLEVDGAVPIGAGLSSSAALSCSVALALRDLFAPRLSERELIDVARAAENDYAGAPTGVLDQSGGGGGGGGGGRGGLAARRVGDLGLVVGLIGLVISLIHRRPARRGDKGAQTGL